MKGTGFRTFSTMPSKVPCFRTFSFASFPPFGACIAAQILAGTACLLICSPAALHCVSYSEKWFMRMWCRHVEFPPVYHPARSFLAVLIFSSALCKGKSRLHSFDGTGGMLTDRACRSGPVLPF